MNKIVIVICIFLSILFVKLYSIERSGSSSLEHLTNQSDEAIQNLASLYNKDELTIGKINVTGTITGNSIIDKSMNKNTIKEYIDAQINDLNVAMTTKINEVANSAQNQINTLNGSVVKKGVAFRMKTNSNWIAQHNNGGYGPYLYAGNHDQALWRQPGGHPDHTPDRHSFTIEQ